MQAWTLAGAGGYRWRKKVAIHGLLSGNFYPAGAAFCLQHCHNAGPL